MATHIGIGFSQKLSDKEAAKEAALQAKALTQQPRIDLAVIFSTIHYNPNEFLPVIRETLKEARIVGCSTAGIITSNLIVNHGIGVLAFSSDEIHFAVGSVKEIGTEDLRRIGNHLARDVIKDYAHSNRQAFLYFADGLISDNSLILKGLQDILGTAFLIIGAGSSDDFHFQQTFQFSQKDVMTNGAAGFIIGGSVNIGLGSRHGWKPLGKPRFIDRVEGNIIRTIDGKKAATIYDEYFGSAAQNLRSSKLGQMAIRYPLGIYIPGEKELLLRSAVSIDPSGGIFCQGHIPEDAEVHIMISNKESCIQAAVDAALDAKKNLQDKEAQLVIILDSLARQKLLGRAAFQEIKAIKEVFDYSTPIIGMYSYGELCPTNSPTNVTTNHLQNESIIVMAIA